MKPAKRTQFSVLISLLSDAGVEFIVVGGVAAGAHGAARMTLDLDVVYRRTPDNLTRIVDALKPHAPYPRGGRRACRSGGTAAPSSSA